MLWPKEHPFNAVLNVMPDRTRPSGYISIAESPPIPKRVPPYWAERGGTAVGFEIAGSPIWALGERFCAEFVRLSFLSAQWSINVTTIANKAIMTKLIR